MDLQFMFQVGMDRIIPAAYTPVNAIAADRIVLGHGSKKYPFSHSTIGLPEWDANKDPLPYHDGTVKEIWSTHFFEHVENIFFCLAECQRVLCRGGVLNIVVPYGTSHMAVQDLGHRHYFNEDTWKHAFANPYYDTSEQLVKEVVTWKFRVALNVIMGVKGENLALITQLVKE